MNKLLHFVPALFLLLFHPPAVPQTQEIMTAENSFDEISTRYGKVQDYEALVHITRDDNVMIGKLFYKSPNLLRIDFSEPKEQVLVTDGKLLTIYIPKYEVIMEQKLKRRSEAALASMASQQGLHILKKNYGVAYLTGPDPVALDEGSNEQVVNLRLTSQSTSEVFRKTNVLSLFTMRPPEWKKSISSL